jgi:hypothetical protein
MNRVYKFFGVGENFINMLNTISTGRTVSIILEGGELSQPFPLGSGFPQGNAPSPNQFNIGDQILIFKLELCKSIESIYDLPVPDQPLLNNPVQILDPPQDVVGPVPAPVPVPARLPIPVLHVNNPQIIDLPVPPLPVPVRMPIPIPNDINLTVRPRDYGFKESNNQTNKLEAFADDNTVIAKLKREALESIKNI